MLSKINTLVPQTNIVYSNWRRTRSFLPFIGQLSRGLFGTATVGDVQTLANHINQLNRKTEKLTQALAQNSLHMSSFIPMVDKRIGNLKSGIENNFNTIKSVVSSFNKQIHSLETTMTNISFIFTSHISKTYHIESTFAQFYSNIQSFVNGFITPSILSPSTLQQTFAGIHAILNHKYPKLKLVDNSFESIYKNPFLFFARHLKTIFLTVKIPITPYLPFNLFKVIPLSVPINETSTHATQLLNLPEYLAVSSDTRFYVPLTDTELSACNTFSTNSYLQNKQCSANIPTHFKSKQSYIWALFNNNNIHVHNNCDFRFQPSLLKPSLIGLSPSSVLVYNKPTLTLTCPKYQTPLQTCTFCIYKIHCLCSISTKDQYLAPRLTN